MSGMLVRWIMTLIASIGAINWGLSIFFNFDLVRFIDSRVPLRRLDRALYAIIGIAGVYVLLTLFQFA